MKGKSIKIKCEKPYGVIVAKESRNYAQYMFSGAQKALIVSDETVFRLYGNGLKITDYSQKTGDLSVVGQVTGLKYLKKDEKLIKRLFR